MTLLHQPRPGALPDRPAERYAYGAESMNASPDADTLEAYLFRCDDNGLYAITLDPAGANLPRNPCPDGWRFQRSFPLGVQQPVPAAISPEPILRGLRDPGYFVWGEGLPHGTSQ